MLARLSLFTRMGSALPALAIALIFASSLSAVDIDFTGYTTGVTVVGQSGHTDSGGTGADVWFGNIAHDVVVATGIGSAGSQTSVGPSINVNSTFAPGQGIFLTNPAGGEGSGINKDNWWISGLVQFNGVVKNPALPPWEPNNINGGFGAIQLWSDGETSGTGSNKEGVGFGFNTYTTSFKVGVLGANATGAQSTFVTNPTSNDLNIFNDRTFGFALHYDKSSAGSELKLYIDPVLTAPAPASPTLSVALSQLGGSPGSLPQLPLLYVRGNLGVRADNLYAGNDSPFMTSVGLPGDFNSDNTVNGADFLVWQRGGSPNGATAGDLNVWQTNYGTSAPSLALTSVPEPAGLVLALLCGCAGLYTQGMRRTRNS